jgi:uncharacterized protein (DUF2267 family)
LSGRRRVGVRHGLQFATALPPLLRASFVENWNADEDVLPFTSIGQMTGEVLSLRAAHNFAPDDAIAVVARTLRRHVDPNVLDAALADLPPEARAFWEL